MSRRSLMLLALLVLLLAAGGGGAEGGADVGGGDHFADGHDLWAVVVSSSRYWLNYRHTSNALSVYRQLKRRGVPDSRILLMLADAPACDARSAAPGALAGAPAGAPLLLPDDDVDFRGAAASPAALLRALTGRQPAGEPARRRLGSGANSSLLLYLTGHGGDEFLKFHDAEELLAPDLAAALGQAAAARRLGRLLVVADTCQASTLWRRLGPALAAAGPGGAPVPWAGIASSGLGASSYAHRADAALGVHLIDEFSHHLGEYLARAPLPSAAGNTTGPSLLDMLRAVSAVHRSSRLEVEAAALGRPLGEVAVAEFFGAGPPRARRAPAAGGAAAAAAAAWARAAAGRAS